MAYYRLIEWRHSQRISENRAFATDGLPLPSPYLMTLVAGGPDPTWFLDQGKRCAIAFADASARAGVPFRSATRILDLGCGCGRVIRHLPALTQAELVGMDYNPRLVACCRRNLPGRFVRNRLRSPIPAADALFDVAYLMSVFTHLGIETQRAWLAELCRVTRPGGLALVTFHDEDRVTLSDDAREALRTTGFYQQNARGEGSNFMATYQTLAFTERLFAKAFSVVELIPSRRSGIGQALAVLRNARTE
jgi:SAM-dependent methyltransferase